jgi:inner membrane protein
MASLGHIVVGMAAARVHSRDSAGSRWPALAPIVFWAALSFLPDADVIGFGLGVRYEDPWGHRGATHSLMFALALGLVAGALAPRFGYRAFRTGVMATLVVASHALLDTLTDGGLGCALFWPFDLTRYFAPWRPIPVAPIGLGFLSPDGLMVSAVELVLFAPLIFYALRPRSAGARATAAVLVIWLTGVWLIASADPVRERVVGIVLREDTAYAAGYSQAAFRSIAPGQSQERVRRALGAPVEENWFYPGSSERAAETSAASIQECRAVRLAAGVVVAAFDAGACRRIGVRAGTSGSEVRRLLGEPGESCWHYTWSPSAARYRMREVCFAGSTVGEVIRGWR